MDLGRGHGFVLACRLIDCTGWISGQRLSGFFLVRWSKILLALFWWPTTIRINVVHRLGVAVLVVIVAVWP
jgi:hypothetical protein